MFRDKNYLIEKGVAANSREDTFYIVGQIFDEFIDNNGVTNELLSKIEDLRQYLDENRNLINDKKYSIVLTTSIVNRLREDFPDLFEHRKNNANAAPKFETVGDNKFFLYVDGAIVYEGYYEGTFYDTVMNIRHDAFEVDESLEVDEVCLLLREAKQNNRAIAFRAAGLD